MGKNDNARYIIMPESNILWGMNMHKRLKHPLRLSGAANPSRVHRLGLDP